MFWIVVVAAFDQVYGRNCIVAFNVFIRIRREAMKRLPINPHFTHLVFAKRDEDDLAAFTFGGGIFKLTLRGEEFRQIVKSG